MFGSNDQMMATHAYANMGRATERALALCRGFSVCVALLEFLHGWRRYSSPPVFLTDLSISQSNISPGAVDAERQFISLGFLQVIGSGMQAKGDVWNANVEMR